MGREGEMRRREHVQAVYHVVNYENEILSFFFNLINYLTAIIQIYSINHHRVFKSFVAFFSQPQEREVA